MSNDLIAVADLPLLMSRDPDRIQRWVDWGVLPTVTVDGAAYADRAEVDRLRDPLVACAAELDAAEAAGRPILSPEALALVVRALDPATPFARGNR